MTGIITKIWQGAPFGFIQGDDGVNYFFAFKDTQWNNTRRKGTRVEFEPAIQGEGTHCGEPKAINIRKLEEVK